MQLVETNHGNKNNVYKGEFIMVESLKKRSMKELIKSIIYSIIFWTFTSGTVLVTLIIFSLNKKPDPTGVNISMIIFGIFTIISFMLFAIPTIQQISGKYKEMMDAAISKASINMTKAEIEADYNTATWYGKNLKVGKIFTWGFCGNKIVMTMNKDIVWVYESVDQTNYSAYGVFTYFVMKRYYIAITDRNYGMHKIKMKSADVKNVLGRYAVDYPFIINGYSHELYQAIHQDLGYFISVVNNRKEAQKKKNEAREAYLNSQVVNNNYNSNTDSFNSNTDSYNTNTDFYNQESEPELYNNSSLLGSSEKTNTNISHGFRLKQE